MSTSALFLLVALGVGALGSIIAWLIHHRPSRRITADYADQLRALAPPNAPGSTRQPTGIVPLEPADEER